MAPNNFPAIRQQLTSPSIMKMVEQRIGEKSGAFVSSVLDLIGADDNLMKCDPNLVMKEALKAAAIDLPVSKTLGFAYVIPYKGQPQFQIGYRGIIQLAIRSGQFKHINADVVYDGEEILEDRIRGTMELVGKKTSDKVVAYFAYMQLINGFEKAIVWTKERVEAHGKRYSKSFGYSSSPWKSDFDGMAKKTMILRLKSYMPMSIEMATAIQGDVPDNPQEFDRDTAVEIGQHANTETFEVEIVNHENAQEKPYYSHDAHSNVKPSDEPQGSAYSYTEGQQEPDF